MTTLSSIPLSTSGGMKVLRIGDVVRLAVTSTPQLFGCAAPIRFRVTEIRPAASVDGWAWLRGYVLGEDGEAIERRSYFVWLRGIS